MRYLILLLLASCSYQREIWYELSDHEIETRLIEINDTLLQIKEEMNDRHASY